MVATLHPPLHVAEMVEGANRDGFGLPDVVCGAHLRLMGG